MIYTKLVSFESVEYYIKTARKR